MYKLTFTTIFANITMFSLVFVNICMHIQIKKYSYNESTRLSFQGDPGRQGNQGAQGLTVSTDSVQKFASEVRQPSY